MKVWWIKIPIPSKTWAKYASKPRYPTIDETYTILVTSEPIENKDQENQFLMQTNKGRIMVWRSTFLEVCDIMSAHDFKENIQAVFYRNEGDRRTHVKEVTEKL